MFCFPKSAKQSWPTVPQNYWLHNYHPYSQTEFLRNGKSTDLSMCYITIVESYTITPVSYKFTTAVTVGFSLIIKTTGKTLAPNNKIIQTDCTLRQIDTENKVMIDHIL